MNTQEYVIGVDAGGTSTRAVAVDRDGTVLAEGRSGGANPNSHPPAEAAGHIATAITGALTVAALDPAAAGACVVGMAGLSKLSDPAIAAIFTERWDGLGLGCPVRTATDAEAAFASATPAAEGTVLIAGTGSISGRISGRRMVRTVGGYGWLLGDEGSAFWIGRAAVRATLDALHRPGADLGGLPAAVLGEAVPGNSPEREPLPENRAEREVLAKRLITVVNGEPPVRLARFAPLVSITGMAGDPAAETILAAAADHLTAAVRSTREPGEESPVVLVGSVLGADSPVGALVRGQLAGMPVCASADGVLGAAWLAAVDAFGEHAARPFRKDRDTTKT